MEYINRGYIKLTEEQINIIELVCSNRVLRFYDDFGGFGSLSNEISFLWQKDPFYSPQGDISTDDVRGLLISQSLCNKVLNTIQFIANYCDDREKHPLFELMSPELKEIFLNIKNSPYVKDSHHFFQGRKRKEILELLKILIENPNEETLQKFHSKNVYYWFSNLFTNSNNMLVGNEYKHVYHTFVSNFNKYINSLDTDPSKSFFIIYPDQHQKLFNLLNRMNEMYIQKNKNFIKGLNALTIIDTDSLHELMRNFVNYKN